MKKLFTLSCLIIANAVALAQGTITNNAGSLAGATVITFDSPASSTISGLPALGLTISSLDGTAAPFISNVGGTGLGTLGSNALGNNRVGHFVELSDSPAFDLGTIRTFKITLASPATSLGFSVIGWGGSGVDHSVQFFDQSDVSFAPYLLSAVGITANDNATNGFFAFTSVDGARTIGSVVFTPSNTGRDFIGFDNVTFVTAPEPTSCALAMTGLFALGQVRRRLRRRRA